MNRASFKAKVDTYFPLSGGVGAAGEAKLTELVELLKDAADSSLFPDDDGALLAGMTDYDPTRSYSEGDGCFYSGLPRRANKTTTGVFKTADWDLVWEAAKGGMLYSFFTDTAYPVGGGSKEILTQTTLPANTITGPEEVIIVEAVGSLAANANNKSLIIGIGATQEVVYSTTTSGGKWFMRLVLISDASDYKGLLYIDGPFNKKQTITQDPLGSYDISFKVQSTAASDVTLEAFTVRKEGRLV